MLPSGTLSFSPQISTFATSKFLSTNSFACPKLAWKHLRSKSQGSFPREWQKLVSYFSDLIHLQLIILHVNLPKILPNPVCVYKQCRSDHSLGNSLVPHKCCIIQAYQIPPLSVWCLI